MSTLNEIIIKDLNSKNDILLNEIAELEGERDFWKESTNKAKREINQLRKEHIGFQAANKQLRVDLDELEQEMAGLRKDKERLDWLQSSNLMSQEWEEGDVLCKKGYWSIRKFIDKQMEEAQ